MEHASLSPKVGFDKTPSLKDADLWHEQGQSPTDTACTDDVADEVVTVADEALVGDDNTLLSANETQTTTLTTDTRGAAVSEAEDAPLDEMESDCADAKTAADGAAGVESDQDQGSSRGVAETNDTTSPEDAPDLTWPRDSVHSNPHPADSSDDPSLSIDTTRLLQQHHPQETPLETPHHAPIAPITEPNDAPRDNPSPESPHHLHHHLLHHEQPADQPDQHETADNCQDEDDKSTTSANASQSDINAIDPQPNEQKQPQPQLICTDSTSGHDHDEPMESMEPLETMEPMAQQSLATDDASPQEESVLSTDHSVSRPTEGDAQPETRNSVQLDPMQIEHDEDETPMEANGADQLENEANQEVDQLNPSDQLDQLDQEDDDDNIPINQLLNTILGSSHDASSSSCPTQSTATTSIMPISATVSQINGSSSSSASMSPPSPPPPLPTAPAASTPTAPGPPPMEHMNRTSTAASDERTLTDLRPRHVWENDRQAAECRRCNRRFNFLVRRHHCRRCGQIVCDRCSSHRIRLPVEELVEDPMISTAHYPIIAMTPQRICDACIRIPIKATVPLPDTSASARGRHAASYSTYPQSSYHPAHGMPMRRSDSQQSLLTECPVCGSNLLGMPKSQQEQHLNECLNSGSPTVRPPRYIVYTLEQCATQVGDECPICFEEFEPGDKIARMVCLCSYHKRCLREWLERGKGCPVHFDLNVGP